MTRHTVPWIICTVLMAALCYQSYLHRPFSFSDEIVYSDTIVYTDTVKYMLPVPKDSVIYRYKYLTVPLKTDTIVVTDIRVDTVTRDSVSLSIPMTQSKYQGRGYQAWVSGYNARLDSIRLEVPHTQISRRITYKPSRWGLGVQVGASVQGGKVAPYVGVGVSYNLFSW